MSELTPTQITDIEGHLRQRGLDPDNIGVIMDKETNVATFMLYNLSGQLVGYQKYNPNGDKKKFNDSNLGKYFQYVSKESDKSSKMAVWGVESIVPDDPNLFVAEGIFDAVKLRNAGHPAIAVLTNNPKMLKSWFRVLNKKTIAITDNDEAGRKLGHLTDETYPTPAGFKDLGDMSQEQVNEFLTSIGHPPKKDVSSKIPSGVEVRPIPQSDMAQIKDWMLNHHYIRGWPKAVQSVLGVYVNGKLSGGLLYGIGARPQIARELFQNEDGTPVMQNNQLWELQRAFTTDEAKKEVPNLGSMVISRGNDFIRQHAKTKDGLPIKAIISLADSVAGHKGSVYQSTNALYTGERPPLPYVIIVDPKTGKYVRKPGLTAKVRQALTDQGYQIEDKMPPSGKHQFIYPLGKDQRERDILASKLVRPLYAYPKDGVKSQQIPNIAREKAKQSQQPQKQSRQDVGSKQDMIKKLLNSKVKNPETGNDILVRTALKYDHNHPSYKQAMGMTQAYAKKFGINLRTR